MIIVSCTVKDDKIPSPHVGAAYTIDAWEAMRKNPAKLYELVDSDVKYVQQELEKNSGSIEEEVENN